MRSLTIPATSQVEHNWELRLEEFDFLPRRQSLG